MAEGGGRACGWVGGDRFEEEREQDDLFLGFAPHPALPPPPPVLVVAAVVIVVVMVSF